MIISQMRLGKRVKKIWIKRLLEKFVFIREVRYALQ
jgi:hypothetical protein